MGKHFLKSLKKSSFKMSNSRRATISGLERCPTFPVTKMKQAIRRASHQKPPQIADFSERKSTLFYISFRASKRYSVISESLYGKPVPVYENTYELETKEKPSELDLNLILKDTLEECCQNVTYEGCIPGNLVKYVNQKIHKRIMAMTPPRYRFVVQVILMQKQEQQALIGTRCLWDSRRDGFTSASYSNSSMTIISTCHFICME